MITLETIFRSIINVADPSGRETVSQKNLMKNFRALQQHVPEPPSEKAWNALYQFILDYVKGCDSSAGFELPSIGYLTKWFTEEEGNESVLVLLGKIKSERPFIGQDFRKILDQYNEERNVESLSQILINVEKISTVGMKEGKGKKVRTLRGINDSVDYFARASRNLRKSVGGVKTESQIVQKEDIEEEKEQYLKIKKDPTDAFGIYTGLEPIDKVSTGLKKSELMLVNAFTSQGKTTFSMYLAYRAINAGWNVGVVTLEQSFEEIRRQIYVKHTCHAKWEAEPKFAHLVGTIDINDVSNGLLSPEQEEFYFSAMDDLNSSEYGRMLLWQPSRPGTTVYDVEFKALQWQQELSTDSRELELIVCDYISLLTLPIEERSRDNNENGNIIIKQLKGLCNTFDNGRTVRMVSPFQASRKGFEEAKANDGVYSLTGLSNLHEAERSADIVMSLYMDVAWREEGKIKVSCQKMRRHPFFKPFFSKVNFSSLFFTEGVDMNLDEDEAIEKLEIT